MTSCTFLPADIKQVVQHALAEDVGNDLSSGDITAQLIPKENQSTAEVISRETAILCGTAWFDEVFLQLGSTHKESITIEWHANDGDKIQPEQRLCTLIGNSRALLTGERTALNFLQTLSGTATQTRQYVDAIAKINTDINTRILDTRKTLPGLRTAQKYAVVCGGGSNHRMGLFDAYLIKENHILAAGSIAAAVAQAHTNNPEASVEVEVENRDELRQALQGGANQILLDNMSLPKLREAVAFTQGRATLEASGNVNLDTVRDIAKTGVDFISVGSLTKHVRAIDLSMRFIAAPPAL
jgi:nicotinate-nucleotide pyrophosphorylase (carboxylating)